MPFSLPQCVRLVLLIYPKPSTAERTRDLVARESELGLLAEHRREAAAGHGGIVVVLGEAGVGKSALLRQFETLATGGRSLAASARCVEFIQTPLGPLRELLQHLEGRSGAAGEPGNRSLIERLTFERGAAATPARYDGWLLEAIDSALARLAARGTLFLLIEDIHWADRSTLNFLTFLADRIAGRRMLVIATGRSEAIGSGHKFLTDFAALLAKAAVSEIHLGPLDQTSTQTLIHRSLPHSDALDAATVAEIVRRSRGNAFFAEELTKDALRTPHHRERLPLSIRGSVLSRASALSEEERRILTMAAVLGERFSIDRLIGLCGEGRDAVLSALERAQTLQLVFRYGSDPNQLAFRHALTQEALYGEVLAERVRPIHEAIGRELEKRHDLAAVSVELAHHWACAGDEQRAAKYAEAAGDQAFAMGASADALSYYERALARPNAEARARLEHKIGMTLGALGRLGEGALRLRRAADLYWNAGDFAGFAANAAILGGQLYNAGETVAAIDVGRRAIDALTPKLPKERIGLLRARMSFDCIAALDFATARALVRDIDEPVADALTAAFMYQTRFKLAAMSGDIAAWRADVKNALDAAERVDDDGYRVRQTNSQVSLDALALGEIRLARECLTAALSVRNQSLVRGRSLVYAISAVDHTLRGEFAAAAALLASPKIASEESYAVLAHVKIADLVLGICRGDERRIRLDDAEPFLQHSLTQGMKLAMMLLGGPYAWALGLNGEVDEAAHWIRRMAKILPGAHRFMFAFLAAAQFGHKSDAIAMRRVLAEAAARPQDRVNKAVLGLFDAFTARRGFGPDDPRSGALDSAALFDAIGWPWLAARSYELGGESKRALETYRALGALRDLRAMEVARSEVAVLSRREREVAELIAAGHSNDEAARILHISPRTVEKHVSSALEKLKLRSRLQLGRLLAEGTRAGE